MPKVIVTHRSYGCETGCCGHAVEVDDIELPGSFDFDCPSILSDEIVRQFVTEKVLSAGCDPEDIDWDECIVSDE